MELNSEIIAVGTELLLGNITNTNSRFLSEQLAACGVNVLYHTVVGDNKARLTDAFNLAKTRANVIILTGGLGPTQDDITKETIFEAIGLDSEFNEDCYNKIVDYFKAKGKQCPDNNKKQAYFPKEAIICENSNGTAPGCILELNNLTVVILPGPPKELEPMFRNCVAPYLSEKSGSIIFSRTINLLGIGESEAAEKVADLLDSDNPTAAFYAKTGVVQIRVTAKSETKNQAELLVMSLVHKLVDKLSEYVYGYDDDTPESVAVKLLKDNGKTVAVAESLTGGLITKKITDIAGASEIFQMGFCTYSNEAKIKVLKVHKKTLKLATAISGEVARLMAEGAMKQAKADFGIATTGLAGPTADESGKPVGTVYIAVSYKNNTVAKKLFINRGFDNDREYIREVTSVSALNLLIKAIRQYCGNDGEESEDTILSDSLLSSVKSVSTSADKNEDEQTDNSMDAFVAMMNERKIESVSETAESDKSEEIKEEVTEEVIEETEAVDNSADEDILNTEKKNYNFDLFE